MADKKGNRLLVALDAGGTMTDTFLVDEEGLFSLGKALTNYEDESKSFTNSIEDACHIVNLQPSELYNQAFSIVYTGTTMLNTLLTGRGQKVGLLVTRGFEHIAQMERGLTWLSLSYEDTLHYALHEHTAPLVDVNLVKGITERIKGPTYYVGCHLPADAIVVPLSEEDVRKSTEELLDAGVEVIGILFLHSYTSAVHEQRAAEIAREVAQQRGLAVPVITSHEISQVSFETQRCKSLLLQCYAAQPVARQLFQVEEAAKNKGYRYELQTLLSYGATTTVHYPRLYETVISGPAGGLLGGKALLGDTMGLKNIVCTDLGGTSFDIGIVARGEIPVEPEPAFAGHKLNLPMLSIDSVGAGTGCVIHVDEQLKTIDLGPESAGALIGTCYQYPDITLSDIDVILGYLNPDYFLGGAIKLNREAALKALDEHLAKPLGGDLYDTSSKVIDLLHSQLRDAVNSRLLARGFNPAEFTLISYGGSGPLHMWGLGDGLQVADMVTVPWAAAFSAFGVCTADYFHRYEKSVISVVPFGMPDEYKMWQAEPLNQGWEELEQRAYEELEREGFPRDKVSFRYFIYARYLGQLTSWEAPVDIGRVKVGSDMDNLLDSFERTYAAIYPLAVAMRDIGCAITAVGLQAYVDRVKPKIRKYPLKGKVPPKNAHKGQRDVYHGSWMKFDLWEMDLLEPGNRVEGPAVIEHPMTTLVVPPEKLIELDEHLIIWYRDK
ncbi:MAG TPA: hydantoinase/oxoprolinase family protein [Dehalococcoidia bacterium]|nr:hydantoinase/oxoprolinase family protein [Dehalococcoidia bacterium]